MKRREFISTLIAAAIIPAAQAQQQQHVKVHRIAVVSASTALAPGAFFEELRRLGYVEGRNLVLERYSGEGRTEHYGELARNVVRQKPDLIFANSSRLVREFKAATAVIPIVAVTADPIAFGLVASLARPGGNITGVSTDAGKEILGKYLEVLRDIVPAASRVAYLAAKGIWETRYGREMQEVAQRSGISLLGPPLEGTVQEAEYRRVFTAIVEQRADALIVADGPDNYEHGQLIVELTGKHRLPTIYPFRHYVDLGGLMAYAIDLASVFRRAANLIDQVLKGANPGEMPIYQPTKFELVINLKTARALGLTVPPALLAQADEVIE